MDLTGVASLGGTYVKNPSMPGAGGRYFPTLAGCVWLAEAGRATPLEPAIRAKEERAETISRLSRRTDGCEGISEFEALAIAVLPRPLCITCDLEAYPRIMALNPFKISDH